MNETNYISGLSAINFEQIAKERIYESINTASLDSMKVINEAYDQLKNRLGGIPMLTDFYQHQTLDSNIIATKKHTYYQYLVSRNEIDDTLSKETDTILKLITKEIATGHRLHELILIEYFIKNPNTQLNLDDIQEMYETRHLPSQNHITKNAINTLSCDFFVGQTLRTYQDGAILVQSDHLVTTTATFRDALQSATFRTHLVDLIALGTAKNHYYNNQLSFTPHQRYRRRDTLRMLGWDKQMVDQNIGGYTRDEKNKNFVIFITLDKGDNFKGALMAYEDKLVDQDTMHWFTKSPRTMKSPEVKILYNEANRWNFYVFAKKSNDDDSTEFYYLGEAKPLHETIKQTSRKTSDGKEENVVHMDLKFKNPIDHRLYKYLTSYEDFVE